jgi:hypothetical protein
MSLSLRQPIDRPQQMTCQESRSEVSTCDHLSPAPERRPSSYIYDNFCQTVEIGSFASDADGVSALWSPAGRTAALRAARDTLSRRGQPSRRSRPRATRSPAHMCKQACAHNQQWCAPMLQTITVAKRSQVRRLQTELISRMCRSKRAWMLPNTPLTHLGERPELRSPFSVGYTANRSANSDHGLGIEALPLN